MTDSIKGIKVELKNGHFFYVQKERLSSYMLDKLFELMGESTPRNKVVLIEGPGVYAITDKELDIPRLAQGYTVIYTESVEYALEIVSKHSGRISVQEMLERLNKSRAVCRICRVVVNASGQPRRYLIADNVKRGWADSIKKIFDSKKISYEIEDIHVEAAAMPNTKKLVAIDNYDRDYVSDYLIADNVDSSYAEILEDGLQNMTTSMTEYFPVLKDNDYKLKEFEP